MKSPAVGFWLFVAVVASIGVAKTVLSDTLDPDLFWHLRVAEQLRADGIGPIVDRLSFTSIKTPWTPYSWLAELFMEWCWRTFGWRSAIVVEAAATVAVVVLIALCCLEFVWNNARAVSALATAVGAFFAIPYLAFRPATFAIALLGVAAWLLLRDRRIRTERPSRAVWLVVPITALLTNIHLTAVLAPIWVACLLFGAVWDKRKHAHCAAGVADWHARNVPHYGVMLALVSLACLATPMLPGVVRTGWHYLAADAMVARGGIEEVGPANIPTIVLTALIGLLLLRWRRVMRMGEGLWFLVTAVMMLRMGRFAPLLSFIAAPLLAMFTPRPPDAMLARRVVIGMLSVALLVSTIRIVSGFPWTTPMGQWLNRRGPAYPVAAAAYVEKNVAPRAGRMINEFNWGGYLAWRLGDKYQVFVDGRTQLYGEDFWRATYLGTDADAAAVIKEAGADVAIIPRHGSRFRAAIESLDWKSVYDDNVAEVFVPPTN